MQKVTLQIGLRRFFLLKKSKELCRWPTLLVIHFKHFLMFYEEELQKTNQKEFRVEKVIKKRDDKLFVKWKEYDNSFNSWIDKKRLIKK